MGQERIAGYRITADRSAGMEGGAAGKPQGPSQRLVAVRYFDPADVGSGQGLRNLAHKFIGWVIQGRMRPNADSPTAIVGLLPCPLRLLRLLYTFQVRRPLGLRPQPLATGTLPLCCRGRTAAFPYGRTRAIRYQMHGQLSRPLTALLL